MRKPCTFVLFLLICIPGGVVAKTLVGSDLEIAVKAINEAQNGAMLSTATIDDLNNLFGMYTENFVYVHEVYGGIYTRDELYNNAEKYISANHYKLTEGRYKVLRVIPGFGAAAV